MYNYIVSFMHKKIKRFYIEGVINDDSAILRMRENYIRLLKDSMRLEGYVIRLDIDPDFSIEYNGSGYNFVLSVYGCFIGKKNALCIEAIDKNRPIFMQQNKLKKSSQIQV
jgi:hypothetical protein